MAVPLVERRLAAGGWGHLCRPATTLLWLCGAASRRPLRHQPALAHGRSRAALPHGVLACAQPLAFARSVGYRIAHRSSRGGFTPFGVACAAVAHPGGEWPHAWADGHGAVVGPGGLGCSTGRGISLEPE